MLAPHTYVVSVTVACTSASLGIGAAAGPALLSMTNIVTVGPPTPPTGFRLDE